MRLSLPRQHGKKIIKDATRRTAGKIPEHPLVAIASKSGTFYN
jgi:hypothetical protein